MYGRNQRNCIKNEEVILSTVQYENLFISMMIDIQENRDVTIADVVWVYLLAIMDDYVLIKPTRDPVETMLGIIQECI